MNSKVEKVIKKVEEKYQDNPKLYNEFRILIDYIDKLENDYFMASVYINTTIDFLKKQLDLTPEENEAQRKSLSYIIGLLGKEIYLDFSEEEEDE